jgi:hypothetical protein
MKTIVKTWLAVSTLGILMTGCGTGDEGKAGAARFNSSLTGTTQLGALTPADASRFCNERADWELAQATNDLPTACRGSSFGFAQLSYDPSQSITEVKAMCTTSYDTCLKGGTFQRRDCGKAGYPADCTATIAEAEACSTELIRNWKAENAKAPACADLTATDLAAKPKDGEGGPGPDCIALLVKCPTFFDN